MYALPKYTIYVIIFYNYYIHSFISIIGIPKEVMFNTVALSEKENAIISRDKLFFLLIFSLIFIRYCYYGFHYYYQLDDYIQYHNLTAGTQNPSAIIMSLGLLGNRPFAWIADIFVWSRFYPFMIIGVAVISILFAASASLFRRALSRHFGTSYLFCVVYALFPLDFEGTYWMSASTRIVTGLFFASIALYAFQRWCESGKRRFLCMYIPCQFLACGFYEQVLIFSVASILVFSALNFKEHRRRSLRGLYSPVNAVFYFLLTQYFSHGAVFTGRGTLVSPVDNYYWHISFPGISAQLKDAFLSGSFYTLAKGFIRGVSLLFTDFNPLFIIALLMLVMTLYFFVKPSKSQVKKPSLGIAAGLIMAAAPVMIFFFLSNSWFSLRGTVPSLCGIALIVDILFALLFGKRKNSGAITALAAAIIAVVCTVSSISELHDYRETTQEDQQFVHLLSDTLKSDKAMRKNLSVGILNLEATYLEDQNYYYHEHIHGVTESGWALHGALESIAGYYIPDLTTLPANPMFSPWDKNSKQLKDFNVLYLYSDKKLIRVRAAETKDGQYCIYTTSGKLAGSTYEKNGCGYLALEPGF